MIEQDPAAPQAHTADTAGVEDCDRRPGAEASLVQAAAKSALARAEGSILAAVGGWWGITAAVLPSLLFVIALVVTNDLQATLFASVGAAVIVLLVSLVRRQPLSQAIGGLIGVLACAFVASSAGR